MAETTPKKTDAKTEKKVAQPIMKITAAHTRLNSRVDRVQRSSSMFSEAPRIGTQILRPGTSIMLTEAQADSMRTRLMLLLKSGSIEIEMLDSGEKVNHKKIAEMTAERRMSDADRKKKYEEDEKAFLAEHEKQKAQEEAEAEKKAAEDKAAEEEAKKKAEADALAKAEAEKVQPEEQTGTVDADASTTTPPEDANKE